MPSTKTRRHTKTRRTFAEYLLQTKRWETLPLQNNEEECGDLWNTLKYRNASSKLFFKEEGRKWLDRAWGIFRSKV